MVPTRPSPSTPALDLTVTFDLACRRAGLTHDQVAGLLGMKEQQMFQQLRLQGHFSLTRLIRLRDDPDGRKFLREYWPLIAVDMGLPDVANALNVADAFGLFVDVLQKRMLAQKRMARATLRAATVPEKKLA